MAKYGWSRRGDVLRNMAWHSVKVKSGDTLASIAKSVKPAQTVAYIKKWNGLSSDTIKAGQTIKVFPYYVVQWGDTAGDVAKSFSTTYQELWKLNQYTLRSKKIDLIYPQEKMRLPEGREPEEAPPKPKAPAPPPPPAKDAGAGNDRTGPAPDYAKDDYPAHRKTAGDYYLRIGDCQFVVPPEFINVQRVNTINQGGFMRQKESFKYKNGQSETRIELQLWFTNLEEINGFEVPGPIAGQKFYMDGLRPLMAQLKRQPFLPIVNEYLNDVMDIHAIAFSNLSFTTVEGFPDVIQANLTLYKMDVDMYIGKPSWTYDQHFIYPMFRWYYNQMLVLDKPAYSTTFLSPVEWANFTDDVGFSIINEGFLRERKATNKMKDIDLDEIAFDKIELPDDLICTGVFGSFGTILQPVQMDMREHPTFQYMGGGDTQFYLTFETMNRDAIALLDRMYSTLERYSRQYRDKFVSGYVRVKNSLINMAGVHNIMIQDMSVATVPGQPDLFRIQLSVVSYKDTQYQDQRLGGTNTKGGFNIVTDQDASEVAEGNMGVADKYLHEKNEPWFITEEGLAEGLLDQLELYPDLELPTYGQLNTAIATINTYRKKKGYGLMPYKNNKLLTPMHLYREYDRADRFDTTYLHNSTFVDPDFYYTYPEWKHIKWIADEFVDDKALDVQLGISEGYAKKTTGTSTTTNSQGMPTVSNYKGPNTGAHGQTGLKDRIAGTDKWNSQILKVAKQRGVNPVFVKVIMAIETGGKMPTGPNSAGAYGLMQVIKRDYNKNKYNWTKMSTDAEYQINAGIDVLIEKYNAAKSAGSPLTIHETSWRYYGKITSKPHTKTYAEQVIQMYTGLGFAKTDPVMGNPKNVGGGGTGGGPAPTVYVGDAKLLDHAEADVIIPIPKDKKEEKKLAIESGKISDAAIMKGMLHDMKKYSKRGSMVRAFPSYVLCFVDEGMWVDYRRLWNNYYTYHAVEEIAIVKERENPVNTATIRLQNIYGALNSTNRAEMKAASKAATLPGWQNIFTNPSNTVSKWFNAWFPKVDGAMVSQRQRHIEKSGFYLRAGARVHIRMGYGSVASMMPITFNGRITQLDVGDIAEVICQSDGLELIEPNADWAADSRKTWTSLKQEPKDIIDDMLVNREGWDVLGNYSNAFWRSSATKSKFGIEHFGYVQSEDPSGFWDGWFTDAIKGAVGREVVNGYDARKNIYASNGHGKTTDEIFDGEVNVHYWETNKSPWDVMQLLTSVIPDYELKVHEHTFHSTLFYGEPHWYLKHGYYIRGKDTKNRKNYWEVMKPSQQFHHFDSMFDICTNKVKASDKGLCTVAVPIFSFDESPRAATTLYADPHIKPELQKTDMVDTSLLQDFPMGDFIAEVLRWTGHTITDAVAGGVEAIGKLFKWDISLDEYVIDKNSRTERLAIEAAKTHIQWKFRTMYQGDLVVLGDTAVRPGDMISIADAYTQMFGQAEVGRVVHVMGMGTGFLTTIKPDLLAVRKDGRRAQMLPEWSRFATYLSLRTLRFTARRYIFKKEFGMTAKLTKTVGWIRSFKKVRNTATAGAIGVSALAPPIGWVAIIGELALWVASELIIDSIEAAITQERAGVVIMPLWYKNRPYVAGIDGHKELIPNYWDENIYGEIIDNPDGPGSGGGGGGAPGGAFVPEGYSFCLPTTNQRLTSGFGMRKHPVTGENKMHNGVDYGAVVPGVGGDPIYNLTTGVVDYVNNDPKKNGWGKYVVVLHELDKPITWGDTWLPDFAEKKLHKFYTLYAHLDSTNVSKGQKVKTGSLLGKMGNTGVGTAAHLHVELRTHFLFLPSNDLNGYTKAKPYDIRELYSRVKAYKPKKS